MARTTEKGPADGLVTQERTTDAGTKYVVSRPQGSKEAESRGEPDSHGPPFQNQADWTPGSDWQDTDDNFRGTTGITKWKIDVGGDFYHYRLWFLTEQTYNYTFMDQAGQGYVCNVWVTSHEHYIDYNSNAPNINRVSGE